MLKLIFKILFWIFIGWLIWLAIEIYKVLKEEDKKKEVEDNDPV